MEYDDSKYPWQWTFTSKRGYCFQYKVPCRILGASKNKIKIAALLAKGGEKEVFVKRENLRHSPCRCWGACIWLDLTLKNLAQNAQSSQGKINQ